MCLAAACGRWDAGFEPSLEPAQVLMCGVRDLDAGERVLVETAGVGNARPSEVVEILRGERVYVHLDLDVLDPSVLPAQFAVPNGLSDTGLRTLLGDVARSATSSAWRSRRSRRRRTSASARSAPRWWPRSWGRCCRMTDGLSDPRRLAALAESGLVDSPPEAAFDRVTRLVAETLHVPVALFTLVTPQRQVFKSSVGVGELRETPLSHSFCRHVVDSGAPLEVVDARTHPKVRDNPAIEDYGIVAYLGMPLTTSDGVRLGALCAIDHEPRQWTGRDHGVLEDLAGAAMAEVELRRANRAVAAAAAELHFAATHDSAHAARQPPRAARRPRPGAGRQAPRDVTRCWTSTACAASTTRTGTTPATSCWRGWRPAGERARRRRPRLPARRRAAVRAADGHGRGGDARGVRRLRRAELGPVRASAAARRRSSCRARRRASPPCCASRMPGWHATGMLRPLALDLEERRAAARLGGGEEKIARQHEAGKLTARERIALLIDDGTFTELGIHARPHFSQRAMDGREAPADGVITGFGEVDGRFVAVAAYDFTVMAGSMGMTGEIKVARLRELALTKRIPIVWLLDSAGARIQEAVGSLFAGTGHLFREEVGDERRRPAGGGADGAVRGGHGVHPGAGGLRADGVSGRGSMALAGPHLVRAAIGEDVTQEELGGARVHCRKSGVGDLEVADDEECIARIKQYLSFFPSHCEQAPPQSRGGRPGRPAARTRCWTCCRSPTASRTTCTT